MFNKLFDFNQDGQLDAGESALEFMTFQAIMSGDSDSEDLSREENGDYEEDYSL